jgi:hypothetical protein
VSRVARKINQKEALEKKNNDLGKKRMRKIKLRLGKNKAQKKNKIIDQVN